MSFSKSNSIVEGIVEVNPMISPAPLHLVPSSAPGSGLEVQEMRAADLSYVNDVQPASLRRIELGAPAAAVVDARLEVLEDELEPQIGSTLFMRARNIERHSGIKQLYVKFEGVNPTGTHKDRVAYAQVREALRNRYDAITAGTCGNYGLALAWAASVARIRCIVYIPEAYHTSAVDQIIAYGAEVIRVPSDYEKAVAISSARAMAEGIFDANPGGHTAPLQMRAYAEIAFEIVEELGDAPAVVAIPCGNGTTVAGVYLGFKSLLRRSRISRLPKIVAAASAKNNAVLKSLAINSPTCVDLAPGDIRESGVNEPIISWRSLDGDDALEAIRSSGGWGSGVTDKELIQASRLILSCEGLCSIPASASGLAALLKQHQLSPLSSDRYVCIVTGRKL